jgi:hypothetical protein
VGEGRQGGEMTQTTYAHVNKIIKDFKRKKQITEKQVNCIYEQKSNATDM